MKQEPFKVEQFMDKYETSIDYNLGETCVDSISLKDVLDMYDSEVKQLFYQQLMDSKLTYGHIKGDTKLKEAIAQIYNDRNGDITEEEVVITNGAIGGNFLFFYSFIQPGDTVIVVDPTYQQLSSVPNMFGAKVVKFELEPQNNYQPDLPELSRLIDTHKPKLLVLNNPNNPSGAVWDDEVLSKIVNLCKPNGTYIFCDEVYAPLFHSTNPPKSIVNFGYANTISSGSMSKAFSMAGVRLGWLVTKNPLVIKEIYLKRDYNTISVSMIDEKLSILALNQYKKILARNYKICLQNLNLIENFLDASNGLVRWVRPNAGSTCFLQFKSVNTYEMCEELANDYKTLMVPGEVFDKPGFCRVGFGNSRHDIEGGLNQVKLYLEKKGLWK